MACGIILYHKCIRKSLLKLSNPAIKRFLKVCMALGRILLVDVRRYQLEDFVVVFHEGFKGLCTFIVKEIYLGL